MKSVGLTIVVLFAALVLTLVVFRLPLIPALGTLLEGSFGSVNAVSRTLVKTCPLLLCGLGITFAWRAGMYNIGGEGQFVLGGVLAATLFRFAPGISGVTLLLLCSILGGALWAALAGWMYIRRGVQLVISTILLNFVALQLLSYGVTGPLRAPGDGQFLTEHLPREMMLPRFSPRMDLHLGVVLAVLLSLACGVLLSRTKPGFLIRVAGQNPRLLTTHRISAQRVQLLALALSGALCGLAGGVEYTAMSGQIGDSFSQNWGFLAIPVALLGRLNPWGVVASALYFGALFAGSTALERTYPANSAIIFVIQAVAVLALLALQHSRKPEVAPA